ncbi:hypothetical protein E2562_021271 [Oryza meyeriana var. granulata]|uniref:Uncharacterized protein n=1 Tax=Oryza meyeriana var. granulata TaxID=110450 RepID=A0A6G1BXA6_9ORYZ|nr:hypothetical protein E2562_021271 [Oryza meyeriana var. granulata]
MLLSNVILGATSPCCCFLPNVALVVCRCPRYLCVSWSSLVCHAIALSVPPSSSPPRRYHPQFLAPGHAVVPCATIVWSSNAAVLSYRRLAYIPSSLLLFSSLVGLGSLTHRRRGIVNPAVPACLLCCALGGRAHFGPSACHCYTNPSVFPSPVTPAYMSSSHPDRRSFET